MTHPRPLTGGEPRLLMNEVDWSRTSLGERASWPAVLRTTVDMVLASPLAMALTWGPDHVLIYNAGYARSAGDRHPAAFGSTVQQAWPEAWEWAHPVLDASLKGASQVFHDKHFLLDHGTGSRDVWLDLFYSPIAGEAGAPGGVLCVAVDTTERVLHEQEKLQVQTGLMKMNQTLELERQAVLDANRRLANETGFLRDLFHQAPGFIAVLRGPEHVFELANPSFMKLLGDRDLTGKTVREAVPEAIGQGFIEVLDRVFASGESFVGKDVRLNVQIASGQPMQERVLSFVYQPIKDGVGVIEGIFVEGIDTTQHAIAEERLRELNETLEQRVAREVAARAQAEETLRHMQKMDAIGQLTGGVAHDFNNVLQIISSNLELLQTRQSGEDQSRKRVDTAISAVERGARLSSHLLAFARRQPLRPEVLNLRRLFSSMDELQRSLGEAVEIRTVISDQLWNTQIDPGQLENVVLNIAINARDAMNGAGALRIEVDNLQLDEPKMLVEAEVPAGDYVLLSISDTGCGMTPAVAARAFEPFFTTKPEGEGTGLGLSMAYGFVRQSQGYIALSSEPGQGTTVSIYLPRSLEAETPPTLPADGPVVGGTETVLVVEDDPDVSASVVDMLGLLGYRVLSASNAAEALRIVQSNTEINLLFTDVVMPGPIRSPDMAREAKRLRPELAVLFTSGYTQDAIVHGGRLDAGLELLSKPYRIEELGRKIRQMLGSPPAAPMLPILPMVSTVSRILVVEDNLDAQYLVCEMLMALGHEAEGTARAEEALLMLASQHFDLLFTDVNLPGMSGVDLARQAVLDNPTMKVVFASGYGTATSKYVDFPSVSLAKPYDLNQLEEALNKLGVG